MPDTRLEDDRPVEKYTICRYYYTKDSKTKQVDIAHSESDFIRRRSSTLSSFADGRGEVKRLKSTYIELSRDEARNLAKKMLEWADEEGREENGGQTASYSCA